MKRILSLVLALVLCTSLAVPALAADFSDVPANHSFYSAIADCSAKGIVGGYSDGTFQPGKTVTRSNFTVMLSRAFYADDVTKYSTESNLKYGAFFPNYTAMRYNGILKNTGFGEIDDIMNADTINKGISRYEMAQMMTNIMTKQGFAAGEAEKAAAASQITDYSSIPGQYQDAVANVYALGIIGGYSDGTFGGTVTMNRGQAAVVIYRLAQLIGANSGAVPSSPVSTDQAEEPNSPNNTTDPNTPSQSGKTLVDGSAITEANVMRLMEAKVAEWGNKTWGNISTSTVIENVYPLGNSGDVKKIVNQYVGYGTTNTRVSCTDGCGGWATYLSDAAFGSTGFPLRKTTVENVRAGDIVIDLIDGKISHISIASGKTNINNFGSYTVTNHGEYTANAGQVPGHSPNGIDPTKAAFTTNYDSNTGVSRVIYTRYPA